MRTPTIADVEVRSSHLRAFRLPTVDGVDRLALVPEQAVLLAGDHVTVSVRVPAGRSLEVIEPGGTVAYAMRGHEARWDVHIEVEEAGRLLWHGEPFVVAEGADVRRTLGVGLGAGASLVLRETMVLGRTGEAPGRLRCRTDIAREGSPLLVEDLDCATGLGPHRVLDQIVHLGAACEVGEHSMVLESGDTLDRWLGAETHASPLRVHHSSASPE
ncbi:urease accessory protein UreD [Nocardioides dilutus]